MSSAAVKNQGSSDESTGLAKSASRMNLADAVREDFPILRRVINGHPLAYLDNAATTQKPRQVIDAIVHFYEHSNANVHRGGYTLSNEASDTWEAAREEVRHFLNAASSDEVVFTRNATESLNLVAYSLLTSTLKKGDLIVGTEMEHHANLVPWQQLALRHGMRFEVVGVLPDGTLDLDHFDELLTQEPKLVTLTHCSNVLGSINPVKELAARVRKIGAIVVIDGAQAAPHLAVDVREIDCDFYAFSGHKLLGPTGIGVLYGKKARLAEMTPFLFGGDMISEVFVDRTTFRGPPTRFEAGTPDISGGIGLAEALRYLGNLGLDRVRAHEKELVSYALETLRGIDGISLYGPANVEHRSGVVSFNVAGVHPHDVATVLDLGGVAVRSGDHCGQPLLRKLGLQGTVRASFYVYSTRSEVDRLVSGVIKAKKMFGAR